MAEQDLNMDFPHTQAQYAVADIHQSGSQLFALICFYSTPPPPTLWKE